MIILDLSISELASGWVLSTAEFEVLNLVGRDVWQKNNWEER